MVVLVTFLRAIVWVMAPFNKDFWITDDPYYGIVDEEIEAARKREINQNHPPSNDGGTT